jgi:uroporphyrinogen decarboxylase
MKSMSKWERVEATLCGAEVDRVPMGFWRHYFLQEWAPRRLAELTLAFHRQFDTDFVKLTPSGIYPLQDWGPTIRFGRDDHSSPEYVEAAVASAEEWPELPRIDVTKGSWGRELETIHHLAGALDDAAPLLMTTYSPLTIASMLCWGRNARDRVIHDLREAPRWLHRGLVTIRDTVMDYAAACLDAGATGLFFATQMSSYDALTRAEYQEFGLAYDLPILELLRDRSRVTMLHACRKNIMLDLVAEYPVDVIHWADRVAPPSLAEARQMTGKALSGGLSVETLLKGTEEDVVAEVGDAIAQTDGRGFILGAGCVISTRTPPVNLHAARRATESAKYGRRTKKEEV